MSKGWYILVKVNNKDSAVFTDGSYYYEIYRIPESLILDKDINSNILVEAINQADAFKQFRLKNNYLNLKKFSSSDFYEKLLRV